jgi:ATP-dependent Lhr-like helicase
MHDRRRALRHRLSIGTISSDGSVRVQFLRGGRPGAVEEQFASRLRRGDRFQFAGRLLELVQLRDMTAFVRLARGRGDGVVPRWQGGQLPLSMALGRELEWVLSGADDSAESRWLAPLLALQQQLSALPGPEHLLVEEVRRREGQFMFVYPLPAATCTRRWPPVGTALHPPATQQHRLCGERSWPGAGAGAAIDLDEAQWRALFGNDRLLDDLRAAVNLGELARRQFRGIARVAACWYPACPVACHDRCASCRRPRACCTTCCASMIRTPAAGAGGTRSAARQPRPAGAAAGTGRIGTQRLSLQRPSSLTPLGFPLWAERLRGQFSNEDWRTRVQRAAQQLERRHGR